LNQDVVTDPNKENRDSPKSNSSSEAEVKEPLTERIEAESKAAAAQKPSEMRQDQKRQQLKSRVK